MFLYGIFELLKAHIRLRNYVLAHVGWGTWNRTKINGFKGHCPTVRRSPNVPILYIIFR